MSGRPVADLVADLRATGDALDRVVADRLTELDAEREGDKLYISQLETVLNAFHEDEAAADALRPPCPSCGGTTVVHRKEPRLLGESIPLPCPDCVDGKVPIERLMAYWIEHH